MAVLLLVYIAFALLASVITIPFIKIVVTSIIVVILIVFTVYIKGFRRLLRFIS